MNLIHIYIYKAIEIAMEELKSLKSGSEQFVLKDDSYAKNEFQTGVETIAEIDQINENIQVKNQNEFLNKSKTEQDLEERKSKLKSKSSISKMDRLKCISKFYKILSFFYFF